MFWTCYKPSESATIRQNPRLLATNRQNLRLLARTCDLRRVAAGGNCDGKVLFSSVYFGSEICGDSSILSMCRASSVRVHSPSSSANSNLLCVFRIWALRWFSLP